MSGLDKKNKTHSMIRFVIVDPISKTRIIDFDVEELRSLLEGSDNYDHYFN